MMEHLLEHYKNRLLQETDIEILYSMEMSDKRLTIRKMLERFIQEEKVILSRTDREQLISRVLDDAIGVGILEPFFQDEEVTEIMVNGPREIYVERKGLLELTGTVFRDETHLRHIIDRMVAPLGRRIDESSPMVDARLKDGSRVHAVIPPVSLNGPLLTIRRFRKMPYKIDDLIERNMLPRELAEFLEQAVKARLSFVVSGGTGSGKTTLLNVLSSFIPEEERIITIEDSAELRLQRQHVVGLEARPANVEGKGEIEIRELVRNALRMRPDRILVGEVRGGEALDMLQAMNTGHEGSMTTIHANSPFDAIGRLETMVLMGGLSLPLQVIRAYILSSVDLIVQTARLQDGTRKVVAVSEVVGDREVVELRNLYTLSSGLQVEGFWEGRNRWTLPFS